VKAKVDIASPEAPPGIALIVSQDGKVRLFHPAELVARRLRRGETVGFFDLSIGAENVWELGERLTETW
jgi:hypothetical protein